MFKFYYKWDDGTRHLTDKGETIWFFIKTWLLFIVVGVILLKLKII